jgi:hypothetical protein
MDWMPRGSRRPHRKPAIEGLESRALLTATLPDIALVSATTSDSRSVTFNYSITGAAVDQPIAFAVYRSATGQVDPGAPQVGSVVVNPPGPGGPTLDTSGQPATAVGAHELTVALPGGLPPLPAEPYVVVAANPGHTVAESNTANDTASFRTYVIGVITHGGVQPKKWKVGGPPWEHQMAKALRAQGYDAVIPYNWVADSNHAGAAARQAPRLVKQILETASEFPAGAPVDLHLIGHSEGTVINSRAVQLLNKTNEWTPGLKAGYLKMTILDPHPANNSRPGPQYSVSNGVLGAIARGEINAFQSKAKDPPVFVPANVQDAEVFYQHTPVRQTGGSNHGIYNLWGQVPVLGHASYFNLTAPGISHSGKFGVQNWYAANVVPTLGAGESFVETDTLTAAQGPVTPAGAAPGVRFIVDYSGKAAPGAAVRLYAAPKGKATLTEVGHTTAGPSGEWALSTSPLALGRYRVVTQSDAPAGPRGRPATMKPTAWPGVLTVAPG